MSKDKRIYKQGYRQTWENNPVLKDWIQSVPGQSDKAYCRYCQRNLYAHRYSVLKHTCTIKHQQNVEKLRPNNSDSGNQVNNFKKELIANAEKKEIAKFTESLQQKETEAEDEQIANVDKEEYTHIERLDEPYNQEIIDTEEEYLDLSDKEDYGNEFEDHDQGTKCDLNTEERNSLDQHELHNMVSSQNEVGMSQKRKTISTHILDTTRGQPATNVPVALFKLTNDEWREINRFSTDNDGRVGELISPNDFIPGCYKIHFDVSTHLKNTAERFLYPFIEISFYCEEGEHYHIPLLLNPFGYSTYRGS